MFDNDECNVMGTLICWAKYNYYSKPFFEGKLARFPLHGSWPCCDEGACIIQ